MKSLTPSLSQPMGQGVRWWSVWVVLGWGVDVMKCFAILSSVFLLAMLGDATLGAPAPVERLGPTTRRTGLIISEIMYHPSARVDGKHLEFVELYNSQDIFEDLSGYRLSGALDFTFPPGTILRAGEFLVIARAPADLQSIYGMTNVLGELPNGLDNKSGTVRLRHRLGAVLLEAHYSAASPWPVAADGAGHSLVLARPSFGATDARAWKLSAVMGGSPGKAEPPQAQGSEGVLINEILSRPAAGQRGFIELYNHGAQIVDLAGAVLTDDPLVRKFVLPPGTVLGPGEFMQVDNDQLSLQLDAGGAVYLVHSELNRVLDAVRVGPQQLGQSWGRDPDGAERLVTLSEPTPRAANRRRARPAIVINEIMFNPISGSSDDEYVELFNRSPAPVSLKGWKFVDGIDFTFPDNAIVAAKEYLVVARNASRLLSNYPNLTTLNTVGDYAGSLGNGGQRLALAMPDPLGAGNQIVVDEVTYGTGGRWGQWSDGGGSSLELVDPESDNQLAPNWADSDESAKSDWTSVEVRGVLDNGIGAADQLQMIVQGVGECLVDNVEVLNADGVNLVPNSTFEGGSAGWVAEGSQEFSSLEQTEGYQSNQSYHIRAVARGDDEINRIRIGLTAPLAQFKTATIRAKVRWLRGFPSMLFRLRGNYLEAIGQMTIPRNLGSPGKPNTRARPNTGPAIYSVGHTPVLPGENEPVVVTARLDDPDGIGTVSLQYRVDPSDASTSVLMRDDGAEGDVLAGDGVYSASIPGQPKGTLVAFHIEAADAAASQALSLFPNDAPARECLIRFGEVQPEGSFGTYRLWMTQATLNRWTRRPKLSNTPLDVTFVSNDDRVIYNGQAQYAGSPYISGGYNTPLGALCGYTILLPADDPFLGETELVLDWPGRDDTAIEEQLSYWIAGQLGLPFNCRRYIHFHINGVTEQQRGSIYEDVQQPGAEIIQEWLPDQTEGDFYKIERWFEFSDDGRLIADPEPTLQNFTTTSGIKKLARYRWNWLKRVTRDVNNYTNIFQLVDAVNASAPEPYTSATEALVDIEQWMGIFATEHMIDNFDSYGHIIGKNMYAFKPQSGKWILFMFDIDWVMKESASFNGQTPTAPLFDASDPTIIRMYNHPPFRRAYFRAVLDAVNGPLLGANINPIMDGKYAALLANGVTRSAGKALAAPSAVKKWISDRRAYLLQQLATVSAPFAVATSGGSGLSTGTSPVTLTGTAPVAVKTIAINGIARPVTWTTVTNWSLSYALREGANVLEIQGLDNHDRPQPDTTAQVTVQFTGTDPTAGVAVWINEWMASNSTTIADPATGQFDDWFELFNPGTAPVDLTGFTLTDSLTNSAKFVVPAGTVVPAHGYLLVWADDQPELNTGSALHVNFKLDQAGEEIGLFAPNGRLVDSVRFGRQVSDVSQGRWPDGGALISALGKPTPGASNLAVAQPGDIRIVNVQAAAGNVTLVWNAEAGRSYRVQATPDLGATGWVDLSTPVTVVGDVGTFTEPIAGAGPARYYRVLAQ